MQAQTKSVVKTLDEGVFDIPEYQRSYSWEQNQREDFFQDIKYLPDDTSHFFGNIILREKSEKYDAEVGQEKVFDVVDGQQRLTTVKIFLHVAGEIDDSIKEELDELNILSLPRDRLRLLPQDQDKRFYKDHLLGETYLEPNTPSQERLQDTYDYFKEKLTAIKENDDEVTVEELAERLRYRFELNVVETEGEAEAASIFEGLNDRGKPLSSLEKTKSLLVNMDGRVEGSTKKDINERFGKIYQSLFVFSNGHKTIKNFDEDGFQRFHWGIYTGNAESNSFENLKDEMYNMYRSGEYDRLQSFIDEYTLSLQESADAFDRIFRPEQRPETVETNLNRFLNLGQISNFVPLLIASDLRYGKDDTEKLAKIIKKLETAAFRIYSIDRRRSDTAETKLFTLAHKVDREQLDFDDIIDRIGEIIKDYADDDRFENDLREKNFYQTKSSTTIRYLIYHYGKSLGVSEAEDIGLDKILSDNYDVEHILAEGLDKEYIPDDIDELEEVVHRLGNLTIADSGWNKKYGNLPFNDKKEPSDDRDEAYSNSDLRVQRNLSEIDEFNQESIKNREDEIVEYALNEWDIN